MINNRNNIQITYGLFLLMDVSMTNVGRTPVWLEWLKFIPDSINWPNLRKNKLIIRVILMEYAIK